MTPGRSAVPAGRAGRAGRADQALPRRRLAPAQRRQQLIQATVAAVAERGFRHVSAETIAGRAQVSKGLLWHHFDDLDDLLAETARFGFGRLRDAVARDIDLQAPVPELVRTALRRASRLPRTHHDLWIATREIAIGLRAHPRLRRLGGAEYDAVYRGQEEIFRRGQREGSVRVDLDPHLVAITYQGSVEAMLAHLDAHPELDPEEYADGIASVLLDGITPRAGAHG